MLRPPALHSRSDPPEPSRCPFDACDGSGFQVDEQTNTASDCACRARRVADARAHRLRDRVPRRYMDLSWDRHPLTQLARDPLNADSVRQIKRYCTDIRRNLAEGRGLWLMGHTGTGKTTLGYMVAATATQAQHSVLSFNAVGLLNRIRAAVHAESRETTAEIVRTLAEVELLHIEDLRVARPTEWVLEQLYLIVNARYEEQRAIVFTSDVDSDAGGPLVPDPKELGKRVGARTLSRLIGICGDPKLILGRDNRLDRDVPGARVAAQQRLAGDLAPEDGASLLPGASRHSGESTLTLP
jgi:DNA replication protein DnaC